jgi:hypothetical protein
MIKEMIVIVSELLAVEYIVEKITQAANGESQHGLQPEKPPRRKQKQFILIVQQLPFSKSQEIIKRVMKEKFLSN